MLNEREVLEIQQFYSSEAELSLLEMAMYFQKMMIMQFQCDDTSLQLSATEEGTCYVVTVELTCCRVYLVVYEDCVNVQLSCDSDVLGEETTDLLARKVSMLANRSSYLKELEANADEEAFRCYLWVSVGREYNTNKTLETIMRDFMWMSTETDRYIAEHSAKYADGREASWET